MKRRHIASNSSKKRKDQKEDVTSWLPMELLHLVFLMAVGSDIINLPCKNAEYYKDWRLVCRRWDPRRWVSNIYIHICTKLQPSGIPQMRDYWFTMFTHLKELRVKIYTVAFLEVESTVVIPKCVQRLSIEYFKVFGKGDNIHIPHDNDVKILTLKSVDVSYFLATPRFPLVTDIFFKYCYLTGPILNLTSMAHLKRLHFDGNLATGLGPARSFSVQDAKEKIHDVSWITDGITHVSETVLVNT